MEISKEQKIKIEMLLLNTPYTIQFVNFMITKRTHRHFDKREREKKDDDVENVAARVEISKEQQIKNEMLLLNTLSSL